MNQMNPAFLMPDLQSTPDFRRLSIQRVGVRGVRYPVRVRAGDGSVQPTVGRFDLDVHLPAERKGTHMSRFVELLEAQAAPLDAAALRALLVAMLAKLDATAGRVEVTFPYFMMKTAPVSGVCSRLDYDVSYVAQVRGGVAKVLLKVRVPVTSLCPCSKEIAQYGAHNQRAHVAIEAELAADDVAIDELIRVAEEEASCELWGLLKRPDEKFVTERAYENPKFVEDLARDVAVRLDRDARVVAYALEAESFESIHNHSAFALIERDKRHAPTPVCEADGI